MSILVGKCSLHRCMVSSGVGRNFKMPSSVLATDSSSTTLPTLSFMIGSGSGIPLFNNDNHNNTSKQLNHDQQYRSMTILSKESKEEYNKLNYTARMKASGKPVSPHVTIYAFPIAAISSITNRVTGCVLSFGCFGLAGLELFGGTGTSLYVMDLLGSQGLLITFPVKFAVAFPVTYHYFGAIRHFAWDYKPELLSNNADVARSSYQLFGAATVISSIAAIL